ncbi:hypothetical protein CMUS01_11972 [Colletotrichum musicola]|uniref:C2H2-type domain-containing protein n=1 Tax=Colletotrichum musicola TaxID=2175873 RepID=A0A8H6JSY4_9PEZI|nr:hypothetical protein CMUS01_11972 [Colletotrichum musicola]
MPLVPCNGTDSRIGNSDLTLIACDRDLSTWNGVQQHLKSSVHRQTGISCPFCGVERGTATGLVHHLERGACPKAPVDRDALYLAVRRRDPNRIISKKLLEFHGSPSYSATENSYNWHLDAYECYLCNNLYSKLSSLNQHLSSPAHQQNLYHCPNRQCEREFTTLAATMNHLESEKCGFMRFADVHQNVGRILDSRRMIQF